MKKRVIVIGLFAVCAFTAFHGFKSEKKVNDLLLMNVEALAYDESDVPIRCAGTGSVDCPGTQIKVQYVVEGYSLEELY
ncbi:NVEALA domain-containing protein [uncultured Bacteroides sp.]|uniref:NVEALA domain-containing protein n=1 Tax=uncultured Bacteroides sp. TaxID=162156 RepID=UPI0025F1AE41|nr:NVEALA domain-containing protein [uncultured Bacteroides sp.]